MISWGVRSIGMTAVHVIARVILGVVITAVPLQGVLSRNIAFGIVVVIALVWAGLDGVIDSRAHELVEDRSDLIMRWIIAGLITGVAGGFICYLLEKAGVNGLGSQGLFFDLTSGAAGTALMVIIPATIGIAIGRRIGHSEPDPDDEAELQRQRRREIAVGNQTA